METDIIIISQRDDLEAYSESLKGALNSLGKTKHLGEIPTPSNVVVK